MTARDRRMHEAEIDLARSEKLYLLVRRRFLQFDIDWLLQVAKIADEPWQDMIEGSGHEGDPQRPPPGLHRGACRRYQALLCLRISRASSRKTSPPGVRVTRRLVRSNSLTPSSASNHGILRPDFD